MDVRDIIKKLRELEIKSKILTRHIFSGEYHSAFKGRGMLYKEVREYQHGDDIRFIDWNVSARFNHPFSKVFEEERELTVFFLIDISASARFGSIKTKKNVVIEIASVLAFSAVSNNDKVGAALFTNKVEKYIPPKKGKDHALYIVRELLITDFSEKGTKISEALRRFSNSNRQSSICFVISDFIDPGFEDALKVAAKKHDVIGIKVYDKMDMMLPDAGMIEAEDAETGKRILMDTSDFLYRKKYEESFLEHTAWCKSVFEKTGSELLHVRTDDDYVKLLQKFFLKRNRN